MNPLVLEDFGELAFIISNAVRADAGILCTYSHVFSNGFFDALINLCKYKYNFPLKYINSANTDIILSPEDYEMKYHNLKSEFVENKIIQKVASPNRELLFNVFFEKSIECIYDKLIDQLTGSV